MPIWIGFAVGYFIFINFAAAFVAWLDKRRALQGRWRVPEKTLFLFALLGGALGMFLMMKAIRHKTRHKRFMIGLPALILAQGAAMAWAVIHFVAR